MSRAPPPTASEVREAACVVRAMKAACADSRLLPSMAVLRLAAMSLRLDVPAVLREKDTKRMAAAGLSKEYAAALMRAFPDAGAVALLESAIRVLLLGVPASLAMPCVRKYGSSAAATLRAQPYRTVFEIGGTLDDAEAVACVTSLSLGAKARGHATWHVLQAAKKGDTMVPIAAPLATLGHTADARRALTDALAVTDSLALVNDTHIADAMQLRVEQSVADAIRRRATGTQWTLPDLDDTDTTPDQRQALRTVCAASIGVLTGPPGTGKSHCIRTLVALLGEDKCLLTAPTGRAARNVRGSTVHSASHGTGHDLFRGGGGTNKRLVRRPLQETSKSDVCDDLKLLVVDEASMLTTELMVAVMNLAPPTCHIVLVGDPDQLPPIGCGTVLADILATDACPIARLTTNHRTDNARLHAAAKAVLQGRADDPALHALLVNRTDAAGIMKATVRAAFGGSDGPATDDPATGAPRYPSAQILVPINATRSMYNRAVQSAVHDVPVIMRTEGWGVPAGTRATMRTDPATGRAALRARDKTLEFDVDGALTITRPLAANAPGHNTHTETLLRGDVVMVLKNQNKKRLARGHVSACNGDIGVLARAAGGLANATPLVDFDDDCAAAAACAEFPKVDGWLTLGYAATVHKFQGSECDAVVLPLDCTWDSQLLYTAITRAKTAVTLVGSPRMLAAAVARKRPERLSVLRVLLG